MKKVLLASTAIVAFAGAAAAEVTFSGEATFEYNTGGDGFDARDEGADWGLDLNVTYSQELDNGVTAGVTFEFDVLDDDVNSDSFSANDFVVFLESDMASLFIGDTQTAAKTHWVAVGDMEQDGFSGQDGGEGDVILRGDLSLAGFDVSLGGYLGDETINGDYDPTNGTLEQLSFGATGSFGNFNVAVAYQEEGPAALDGVGDYNPDEIFGIRASTTFGGADVAIGYVTNQTDDENSTGISVSYPIGDIVTLGAYYVDESNGDANIGVTADFTVAGADVSVYYEDDQGDDGFGFDTTYDVGNGITVLAGYQDGGARDDEGFYVGASYDLGGGANLEITHVELDQTDDADGEYFTGDWEDGTTIALTLSF
ncbi:MAG: porin [Shimia sp.]